MGYPPFSAPATIERRKEAKSRSWLRSAKEVFMKPWKRQPANKRVPQARRRHNPLMSPGANPYEQQQPGFNFAHLKSKVQEEFPENHLYGDNVPLPFSGNRLSPDGGPGVSSKESESETEIKIPETAAYGSRPPLSNIFPIANKTSSSSSLTSKNSSKTSATKQVAPSAAKRPPSASPQAPPTTQAQPRPPTLPVTTSPQPASMPPPALTTPPPPVTTPLVATVTPPSVAIPQVIPTPDPTSPTQLPAFSSAQFNQRRHSTPITSSLSAPTTPRDHRRPSASSDISMDKLRNHRRDRRSSATREMPLLPKRGQDPFQCSSHSSTLSTPEPVTPYSEFTGSNISTQLQHQPMEIDPAQIAVRIAISPTASSQRPPVSPGGQPGTQQPAVSIPVLQVSPQAVLQPPHVELQDLQEELDNDDEPDGAENFLSMIEEIEEVEYPQYPPRNFNPISQARAPFPNAPIMKKEEPAKTSSGGGGLGFGVKKGLRLSSKKQEKKQDKKNMQQAVQIPAHLQDPKEGQPEIKGFDGFFLY